MANMSRSLALFLIKTTCRLMKYYHFVYYLKFRVGKLCYFMWCSTKWKEQQQPVNHGFIYTTVMISFSPFWLVWILWDLLQVCIGHSKRKQTLCTGRDSIYPRILAGIVIAGVPGLIMWSEIWKFVAKDPDHWCIKNVTLHCSAHCPSC